MTHPISGVGFHPTGDEVVWGDAHPFFLRAHHRLLLGVASCGFLIRLFLLLDAIDRWLDV